MFALQHKKSGILLGIKTVKKSGVRLTMKDNPKPWLTRTQEIAEHVRRFGDGRGIGDATHPACFFNPARLQVVEVSSSGEITPAPAYTPPTWREVMSTLAKKFSVYQVFVDEFDLASEEEQRNYKYSLEDLVAYLELLTTPKNAAIIK